MNNKTLLVLGAGQLQIPIIEEAKKKNIYTIVVSPDASEPGAQIADKFIKADVRDEQRILSFAKENKINGIVTDQTDLPVRTAAYVAESMGLFGIGYGTGCLFTDKTLMRKKCVELGLNVPDFAIVSSLKELVDFAQKKHNRFIIKPSDSQASHGISICDRCCSNIEVLYNKAKAYSRDGKVIAEDFLEGSEYPVDSFVENGICHTLSIGEYHPFSFSQVFSSHLTVWPAQLPNEIKELILHTNKQVVEGFGLKRGRTHAEYIVTKDLKCYLVEIGARGGGSFFSSDDVRFVTGFKTEEFLIDNALSDFKPIETYFEPISCNCCATLFFYLPENGTIVNRCGIDEVLKMSFVGRNNLTSIVVGAKTKSIIDKGARFFVVVKANDYMDLQNKVNRIKNTLLIMVDNGKSLIGPIWE